MLFTNPAIFPRGFLALKESHFMKLDHHVYLSSYSHICIPMDDTIFTYLDEVWTELICGITIRE